MKKIIISFILSLVILLGLLFTIPNKVYASNNYTFDRTNLIKFKKDKNYDIKVTAYLSFVDYDIIDNLEIPAYGFESASLKFSNNLEVINLSIVNNNFTLKNTNITEYIKIPDNTTLQINLIGYSNITTNELQSLNDYFVYNTGKFVVSKINERIATEVVAKYNENGYHVPLQSDITGRIIQSFKSELLDNPGTTIKIHNFEYLSQTLDAFVKEIEGDIFGIEITFVYVDTGFWDNRDGEIKLYENSNNIYSNLWGETLRFTIDLPEITAVDETDKLPGTSTDKLGNVTFSVDGFNLIASISYEGKIYYFTKSFAASTDMKVFNSIESYYMNINNKPQIIINHSDRPYLRDILEAPEDEKPAFVPHTIWDLTTNELLTRNQYITHVYLKQNNQGVMMSYVYIDEFIIDDITSINLSFTSREKYGFLNQLLFGKYSEWKTTVSTFDSNEELTYKNLTYNWQNYIPIWNIVRGIYQTVKTYEMPRIHAVNLGNPGHEFNITKNEVESEFMKTNKDFISLKDNPRYKVWAIALEQGMDALGVKSEFYNNPDLPDDPRNFKIMSINYLTNGKLYETLGSDMDLKITVNPKDDGLKNEEDDNIWSKVIFVGAVILFVLIQVKSGGFKSFRRFIETTLIIALVGAGIYFSYQYTFTKIIFYALRL